jgi:hypothetical protein
MLREALHDRSGSALDRREPFTELDQGSRFNLVDEAFQYLPEQADLIVAQIPTAKEQAGNLLSNFRLSIAGRSRQGLFELNQQGGMRCR